MTDITLFWISLACYVLSSIAYIVGLVFDKERARSSGDVLAVLGLVLHTVSLGIRWKVAGHGPYLNTYEVVSSTVWTSVVLFLVVQFRFGMLKNLGAVVMPLSFVMMGFAMMGTTEIKSTPPSVRSIWLVIHIVFAKLTVASIVVATALATFYLLKTYKEEGTWSVLAKLPPPGILDDYSYRLVAFGFVNLSIAVVVGSIWANSLWGTYWTWDPLLTWSLILWFVYGVYLHGRITFRWKGTVSAVYIFFAFLCSLITFFIVPFFVKNLHSQYMV